MNEEKPKKTTEFFSRLGISTGAGLAAGLAVWLGGNGDLLTFLAFFGGGIVIGLVYGWLAVKEN